MKAFVIKRDDGKYYNEQNNLFIPIISMATLYDSEGECKCRIMITKLDNCKPVIVDINEVRDE